MNVAKCVKVSVRYERRRIDYVVADNSLFSEFQTLALSRGKIKSIYIHKERPTPLELKQARERGNYVSGLALLELNEASAFTEEQWEKLEKLSEKWVPQNRIASNPPSQAAQKLYEAAWPTIKTPPSPTGRLPASEPQFQSLPLPLSPQEKLEVAQVKASLYLLRSKPLSDEELDEQLRRFIPYK